MKTAIGMRMGVAAALLLSCGFALAQAPMGGAGMGMNRPPFEKRMGPGGGMGRWWNNPVTVEKLKLTDDQRKAMDQILLDHRAKLIDLHADVQKAELTMEPLMGADQPNEAKILAQIDKVAQARAELEKANARFLLALRGKLTPEQWKTLQELRAERHGREGMRGNREGRPGWGGGMRQPEKDGQGQPGMAPPPSAGPQSMMQDEPGITPPQAGPESASQDEPGMGEPGPDAPPPPQAGAAE
jgi:Spy/CpxP family protein refolding chaperone